MKYITIVDGIKCIYWEQISSGGSTQNIELVFYVNSNLVIDFYLPRNTLSLIMLRAKIQMAFRFSCFPPVPNL